MGGKPGAAGDSVQMGSLCRSLPIDDDDNDNDDSGGNLFFSLTFLCFFLIQYNAKFDSLVNTCVSLADYYKEKNLNNTF